MSKKFSVATSFNGAVESQQQQVNLLMNEIDQLRKEQQEKEALASKIQELEALVTSSSESGVESLLVERIKPNPNQPRQTFSKESIRQMAESLDRNGQLTPILVIKQGNDFLIFDGERRWRGANLNNWTQIKAIVIQMETEDLHRQALITSLHREDLNHLDKAEAIMFQLVEETKLEPEVIIRELNNSMAKYKRYKKETPVNLFDVEESVRLHHYDQMNFDGNRRQILESLLDLQLHPPSVNASLFPLLGLPEDLKESIREHNLSVQHILALQVLNAKNLDLSEKKATNIRKSATKKVVEESLSVKQTRELVKELREKHNEGKDFIVATQQKRVTAFVRRLDEFPIEDLDPSELQSLEVSLKEKITKIQQCLSEVDG